MRRAAARWCRVVVVLAAGLVAAGLFGRHHRWLEIASHFQVQCMVMALGAGVLLSALRSWRWVIAAAVAAALPVFNVAMWHVGPSRQNAVGGAELKLMLFNVLQTNPRRAEVLAHVREVDPDVVVFQEVDESWFEWLGPLRETHPHAEHAPGAILRGMAVFSRLPLHDWRKVSFNNTLSPSMAWTLWLDGRPVTMLATHPWPPVTFEADESRLEQLRLVGDWLGLHPRPTILLGDLNTTMWAHSYKDLERRSGLRNAREGFGVLPTHPMDRFMVFRVPIDHCLVSDDVRVRDCRTGDPCGSDHAPLIVDVTVGGVGVEN